MGEPNDPCGRCGTITSPLIETDLDSDLWVCLACIQSHELASYGNLVETIIFTGLGEGER